MNTSISKSRIISLHRGLAAIGRRVGDTPLSRRCSTRRMAYRESESAAHRLLADRLRRLPNAIVWTDPVGNTFIDFPGTDMRLAPLVAGSHLDTVYYPGLYDGVSGCVAAAAIPFALHRRRRRLRHTFRVAFWRAEESTRFKLAMLGSKWFAEQIATNTFLGLEDDAGISVETALYDLGLRPDRLLKDGKKLDRRIAAYFELHIEQAPGLERMNLPAGIVSTFKGTKRAVIKVHGRPMHTGTRTMSDAQDPVPAAGEMVAEVRRIALAEQSDDLVASTGRFESDGSMNQTAKTVKFTLDIRDLSTTRLKRVARTIESTCRRIAKAHSVRLEIEDKGLTAPVKSSALARRTMLTAARKLGLNAPLIPSGAGHDAVPFLLRGDQAGMIFVRSGSRTAEGSYSHNWTETADFNDLTIGSELMYQSVIEADNLISA